jgi:hypothetical protein
MVDFTAPQLDEFRTQYIRDKYTASPLVMLSHYNRAIKANFVDDASINAIKARLDVDFAEELQGVWEVKYNERIAFGDSAAAATTSADNEKLQATYRLCRAEIREMMMEDPGFIGSISDEQQRAAIFGTWRDGVQRDRQFVRIRTAAPFSSVPLERF